MRRYIVVLVAVLTVIGVFPTAAAASDRGVITVIGPYEGDEAEAVVAELQALAGPKSTIEFFPVENSEIPALVAGANPPDIAIASNIKTLGETAEHLVDLRTIVNPRRLRSDYGDYLVDFVSSGSKIFAAHIQIGVKSLVWFKPAEFEAQGYEVPDTFDELVALSDAMVADGLAPWCNYMESGFATGWVGTDWVEELLLGAEGGAVYDAWVDHSVLFADARVEVAFERYQTMIDTPGYVFDRSGMLDRHFFENVFPLVDGDCAMHRQGFFFKGFFEAVGADVSEFATFPMPAVDPQFAGATMGSSHQAAMVNDRPEVRRLMREMVSHRFGTNGLVEAGLGWIVPNARFDVANYTDAFDAQWAEQYLAAAQADLYRLDASDAMPDEVGQGTFWLGMAELVAGAKTVPEVLSDIDASWP